MTEIGFKKIIFEQLEILPINIFWEEIIFLRIPRTCKTLVTGSEQYFTVVDELYKRI